MIIGKMGGATGDATGTMGDAMSDGMGFAIGDTVGDEIGDEMGVAMGVAISDAMGAAMIGAMGDATMGGAMDDMSIAVVGNSIMGGAMDGATIGITIGVATGAMIGAVFCEIRREIIGEKNCAMKIKKGIEIRTAIDDGKSLSPGAAVAVSAAGSATSALREDMNNTAFFVVRLPKSNSAWIQVDDRPVLVGRFSTDNTVPITLFVLAFEP